MPKIRMLDYTAHPAYGPLLRDEVYEVSEDDAAHLTNVAMVAEGAHHNTKTYAEKLAERGQAQPRPQRSNVNSFIEAQVQAAGTRAGDQYTEGQAAQPINQPPTASMAQAETQRVVGPADEAPRITRR